MHRRVWEPGLQGYMVAVEQVVYFDIKASSVIMVVESLGTANNPLLTVDQV